MDAVSALVVSGCLSAFCFGAIVFSAAHDLLGSRARATRLQNEVGANTLQRLVSRGVPALTGSAHGILGLSPVRKYSMSVCHALSLRGVRATQAAVVSLVAGLCVVFCVLGILLGHVVVGVAASCLFVAVLGSRSARAVENRKERLRAALPSALQAMGSCFGAGYTLVQTFSHLKEEVGGALGDVFGSAADAMRAGATPEEALARIMREGDVDELSFVAVALAVQHQTGGSMQRVLDATRESLAEELELRRSLRVQTAQAQLSARVVVAVSIGLTLTMLMLSPSFLQPFFSSVAGVSLLAVAVGMQVAGIACIRRMLKLEVART